MTGADVIDIQWSEYGRLWPLLRMLNPRATLIGTFHDVDSQRLRRVAASKVGRLRRARWMVGAWIAKRFEVAAARHLDHTIVFSDKDRLLLENQRGVARRERVVVVDPPLGSPDVLTRSPIMPPTVIFVGFFARRFNLEAAEWLLATVWPVVQQAEPQVRLRLVGADPDGAAASLTDGVDNASATGFVDDLWGEYAQATLAVVPLLTGAGVKFKTIEALLAGTPVVSTTVGAEGIGDGAVLTAVTDDPAEFASAIIAVLHDASEAEHKAAASRRWAEGRYGQETFVEKVRSIYLAPGSHSLSNGEHGSPGLISRNEAH
ncbi:glycosyltransferase [Raineyella sp. LH-20]|uniref:glycosyltransferase n=1 Tax=Raineyella sp. LH-20 TaxID=3081204 RepID=UPI0029549628|nr:glycosyltransferase [Raineyella sp. LH-20]WOP20112.1 glycosyltransferase [Raineyella sp. LH-20]